MSQERPDTLAKTLQVNLQQTHSGTFAEIGAGQKVARWFFRVGGGSMGDAMPAKPTTIDEYLAAVSDEQRAALEKLRKTIKAAAPKAEECISYQLAAFRLNGKPLVAFGATSRHCAFYPMSGSTVAAHKRELAGYETSTGTIRFQPSHPLPATLVRKLVKARMAELAE